MPLPAGVVIVGRSSRIEKGHIPMAGIHWPQLWLRDWADCASALQLRVLDWADHPAVPTHAGRGMVVASIVRQPDSPSIAVPRRTVHNWIVVDGERPVA